MVTDFRDINDKKLISFLHLGRIGILPSDTLYGVVCSASDEESVKRLYTIKNRDKKPGTIIAASIDQLVKLGIKRRYLSAVQGYWPGPVSVIVPTDNPKLGYLDQGVGTLAVRIVADANLVALLEDTGPLMTSSANLPSMEPASTIKKAKEYFKNRVDFYVDGGDLSHRQPSTLIRIIDDNVQILRQGSGMIE